LAAGFYDITSLGKVGIHHLHISGLGKVVIFYDDITGFERRSFQNIVLIDRYLTARRDKGNFAQYSDASFKHNMWHITLTLGNQYTQFRKEALPVWV